MKRYQVVADLAFATLFFVTALPVEIMIGETGAVSADGGPTAVFMGVIVALIFSTALAVRRWSPPIALGVAWGGAILQMALGRAPTFADIAIFGVLYATAAYGTTRVYWAGFASAVFGALVITLYLFLGPSFASGGLALQTLPLVVAVLVAALFALLLSWTVGALVRTAIRAKESRAAAALAEAEATAEQERVRIARDMHDVVAHSLTVVIAQADGARYAAASNADAATDALATIATTARAALADVRLLLTQLRHSQTDGPQPTLADLEELYAQVRIAGVNLVVDVDPAAPAEPPAAVQLALFRIVQEALTNALRHGDTTRPVSVRLAWLPTVARGAAGVEFEVRNGLKPGHRPTETGHGMIGMGERADLVGGWLNAADRDGAFVVNGVLPVGGAA